MLSPCFGEVNALPAEFFAHMLEHNFTKYLTRVSFNTYLPSIYQELGIIVSHQRLWFNFDAFNM